VYYAVLLYAVELRRLSDDVTKGSDEGLMTGQEGENSERSEQEGEEEASLLLPCGPGTTGRRDIYGRPGGVSRIPPGRCIRRRGRPNGSVEQMWTGGFPAMYGS